MSKLTKGPWKTHGHMIFHNNTVVCTLELNGIKFKSGDARLIAASPELLAALIMLEQRTTHRQGDCYSNDYMGVCVCGKDVAIEAIKKARGE